MCIRCGSAEAPDPLAYCTACVVHARIEVTEGLRRFGRYLAAWAAFEEWCRERGEAA